MCTVDFFDSIVVAERLSNCSGNNRPMGVYCRGALIQHETCPFRLSFSPARGLRSQLTDNIRRDRYKEDMSVISVCEGAPLSPHMVLWCPQLL